jgi:hypothetical protein
MSALSLNISVKPHDYADHTTRHRNASSNIIQLMPAVKVNIIIVHPKGVVFPRALARKTTTSQGWYINFKRVNILELTGIEHVLDLLMSALSLNISVKPHDYADHTTIQYN